MTEYTREEIDQHRALYLKALESGEYPQVQSVLTKLGENKQIIGHCCLGVACEVAIKSGLNIPTTDLEPGEPYGARAYGHEKAYGALPSAVREWLGLEDWNPRLMDEVHGLVRAVKANDLLRLDFARIAAGFRRLWAQGENDNQSQDPQ